MRQTFDYWVEFTANAQISIDDTGNTCLRANGFLGAFILIIRTNDVGVTKILKYGPIDFEEGQPMSGCKCSYDRIEYDSRKVNGSIRDFLRETRATSVEELSIDEVKDKFINFIELL